MSFTGHLLDVKSWLMSKVSSRQCAAESHKTRDCISFGNSALMGGISTVNNSFFYQYRIVHVF